MMSGTRERKTMFSDILDDILNHIAFFLKLSVGLASFVVIATGHDYPVESVGSIPVLPLSFYMLIGFSIYLNLMTNYFKNFSSFSVFLLVLWALVLPLVAFAKLDFSLFAISFCVLLASFQANKTRIGNILSVAMITAFSGIMYFLVVL